MKKLTTVIILTLISVNLVCAQQQFFYSQFFQLAPAYNPAFTGIDDFVDVKISHRNQWSGFEEAPSSNYIGIYGNSQNLDPVSFQEYSLRISDTRFYDSLNNVSIIKKEKIRHGYGGYILYDSQSPFSQISGNANYSAHIPLSEYSRFAFGISLGIINQNIDLSKITLRDPDNDDLYQSLIAQGGNATSLVITPGFLYYIKNFYLGYSAANLVAVELKDLPLTDNTTALTHLIMGGYQIPLNRRVNLQASAFYYYVSSDIKSLDVNLKLDINHKVFVGTSYRTTGDLVYMAGVYLQNKYQIAYSYDMKISGKNDLTNGTHEITLGLMLSKREEISPYVW